MQLHIENCKSILHMAIFFVVMLKVSMIDKKLSLLEKRYTLK